jgi:hypothetical protein
LMICKCSWITSNFINKWIFIQRKKNPTEYNTVFPSYKTTSFCNEK